MSMVTADFVGSQKNAQNDTYNAENEERDGESDLLDGWAIIDNV